MRSHPPSKPFSRPRRLITRIPITFYPLLQWQTMDSSELSRSLIGEPSRSSTASTVDPKRPKGQLGRAKRRQYSTDPTSEVRNPERAQANLDVFIQGIVGRKSQYIHNPITRSQIRLLYIL